MIADVLDDPRTRASTDVLGRPAPPARCRDHRHPRRPRGRHGHVDRAGKLPAHAPGSRRLDTGELPSVRALAQERTRRRGRAPWLAVAAGLVVLIGAVGVVTIAGQRAGDDADVADAPTDGGRARGRGAGGEATATTLAPTSSTTDATTVAALAASPEAAVDDLARRPRRRRHQPPPPPSSAPGRRPTSRRSAADPVGLMTESQEGFGAWPSAADLEIATVPLGPVPHGWAPIWR